MLQVPSAYRAGYEKARGFDAALADNYARHITMGDPELDPVMEELSSMSPPQLHRFIGPASRGWMRICEKRRSHCVISSRISKILPGSTTTPLVRGSARSARTSLSCSLHL